MSKNILLQRYFLISQFAWITVATSAGQVELITTFEGEKEMGVSIVLSKMIEFTKEEIQSPPQLKLIFPGLEFVQKRYTKQISLPPLYRIDALERRADKNFTEVILHFGTLPEYHIDIEDGNIVRISWEAKAEEVSRREKSRRITMLETTVSLNFRGAELIDILRLLAVQNDLNIIAGEDVEGEITVSLRDVNLATALDAILKVNGYDWFVQDNIVIVKPIGEEMTGELTTRVYKLEYVDAVVVSRALTNVLTPKGKVQVFSPVAKGGLGTGIGAAGGTPVSGAATSGGAGLLGAVGGAIAGGPTRGAAGAAGGVGQSTFDHLLVTDTHYNFDRIEEIITKLDKKIPQINISVKFIETKLTMDERLGINWDLRAALTGLDTVGAFGLELGGGWKELRIATLSVPIFTSLLEMLSTDADTRLLQEPLVTTLDNTMASVSVSTTIPILVPQPTGGLIGVQPFVFEEKEISINLNVHPRINEGRFVSMTISATVQAIVGFAGPQADRPIISDRSTQTRVMVANGETLLIGGLIFDQQNETKTTLPFFGKIPLIKKLFTHTISSSEQRELLVFITPNIVD